MFHYSPQHVYVLACIIVPHAPERYSLEGAAVNAWLLRVEVLVTAQVEALVGGHSQEQNLLIQTLNA